MNWLVMTCRITGATQDYYACDGCVEKMDFCHRPDEGDHIRPCDEDIGCESCLDPVIPDDEGYQRCYVSQGEAMILAPEDSRPWVYHRCVYGLVGDGDEVPFSKLPSNIFFLQLGVKCSIHRLY